MQTRNNDMSSLSVHKKYLNISWKKMAMWNLHWYIGTLKILYSWDTCATYSVISDEKVNLTSMFIISG